MSEVQRRQITDPAAWIGSEIGRETSWYYHLSDDAVAEIDAALQSVKAAGLSIPFSKDAFPLPNFAAELDKIADRIEKKLKESPGKSIIFSFHLAGWLRLAGVMVGEGGLLKRLEAKGLKLTRVKQE